MKKQDAIYCDCGRTKKFSAYVYAHWDIPLGYKCRCGIKWQVYSGFTTKELDLRLMKKAAKILLKRKPKPRRGGGTK